MGFFGWIREKASNALEKAKEVANTVKDKAVEVVGTIKAKVSNVSAKISGRDKFEEAEELYERISKRYDDRVKIFEKDVEKYTELIEQHVKNINASKEKIKKELFPAMAAKIKKIQDVKISDEYTVEEYISEVLSVDDLRSRGQLFTIDFNAHKVKTTLQAIFTLGFYTRKKSKETLMNVKEEEGKVNDAIIRMDAETSKIRAIEESMSNVEYLFTSVIEMYENLLIRLDSSINYLLVNSIALAHKIVGKEMSVRRLPKMQQKEVEAIVTASKILKSMTDAQILDIANKENVGKYNEDIKAKKEKFTKNYEAA